MSWNPNAASNYARQNAMSSSHSLCATYVRHALHAGGVDISGIQDAKDYGPALERNGFIVLGSGQTLKAGDVIVIQPYPGGNSSGHIAIYDGNNWYSDFRQRDIWAGPGYRASKPPQKNLQEKLMLKGLFVALLSVMLTSCATHSDDTAEKTTLAFYQQYLQAFADFDPANAEQSPLANNSPLIKRYVASDTASRLAEIDGIYEQEIVGADYFTYCQDYAPEWVKALLVGKASMQFGGAKVPVSIGIVGDKYLQLMVYLKREDNKWKIYRVRNVTDNVEQYIFDDIAIKNAKAYAKDNPGPQ